MNLNKLLTVIICVLLLCNENVLSAQRKMSRQEYVDSYKEIAMKKMREYKIPASITLAQGILESGCGSSVLATEANNHFGIKCHKGWMGNCFYYDDDEKNECFRAYQDAEESFSDHSLFLTSRDRYNDLFKLKVDDYKAWAHGLKKAGYATNPQYAHLLIKIIEEEGLHLYDKMAFDDDFIVVADVNDPVPTPSYIPHTKLPASHKIMTTAEREIFEYNGVKLVYANADDDYFKIADDFGIYSFQLFNYNEKPKNHRLSEGEIVYLEKKKKKGAVEFYFVQEGESISDIAQKVGMTTKELYKKNRMKEGDKVIPGTMLWLTKKKR
ncbi:MAG: glucosaminidase domain-containing protein [Bacteroidales bacterium]|jgi:hypothetical protein|nr:glucosaminidase domain-containing protein [Bacteroidales bacterium]